MKKEKEIRIRYEHGEHLKNLAIIFKIPLRTLQERKAKSSRNGDPWIKGFRAKIGYKEFVEEHEEKKELLNKKLTDRAREEFEKIDAHLERAYSGNCVFDEGVELAYKARAGRIMKSLKLRRALEEIYTPVEKMEIELLKVQIEQKRAEAATKAIELESKKIDLQFKKKELETLIDE
ncbi:hypothetical protein [Cetobacterium sp.]|uniref:hypothetical protein n=1 Tax=Cetobacterium sp. TaxID=2071632 RepID=UPI003F2AE410